MRLTKLTLLALLCAALVAGAGCGGGISHPQVGYVPEGWDIDTDWQYPDGSCFMWGDEDILCGDIHCVNEPRSALVHIVYGDVPSSLKGNEFNIEKLEQVAGSHLSSEIHNIAETQTGTTYIDSCHAGLATAFHSGLDTHYMEIICVKGDTFISIFAAYEEAEQDTLALIDSITF